MRRFIGHVDKNQSETNVTNGFLISTNGSIDRYAVDEPKRPKKVRFSRVKFKHLDKWAAYGESASDVDFPLFGHT